MNSLSRSIFFKLGVFLLFFLSLLLIVVGNYAITNFKNHLEETLKEKAENEVQLIRGSLSTLISSYDYLKFYEFLKSFFNGDQDLVYLKISESPFSSYLIKLEKGENLPTCKEELLKRPCIFKKESIFNQGTLTFVIEAGYSTERQYQELLNFKKQLIKLEIIVFLTFVILLLSYILILRKEVSLLTKGIKNWKNNGISELSERKLKSVELKELVTSLKEMDEELKEEKKLDELILRMTSEILKAAAESPRFFTFLQRVREILKEFLKVNYVKVIKDPLLTTLTPKQDQEVLTFSRTPGIFIIIEGDPLPSHLKIILQNIIDLALVSVKEKEKKEKLFLSTVKALANAVDATSPWTRGHSEKVAEIAVEIGESLGLKEKELYDLKVGGLFHDIGKIGIPCSILNKPGKLTKEEYEVIKQHPLIGYKILKPIKELSEILPIVLYHHERCNGSGYPEGLKCEQIPLKAKIMAVADVVEAMTAERPYKKSYSLEEVLSYLEKNAGEDKLFDPQVVKATLRIKEKIEKIISKPL